jgi:hypothetical protein
VDGLFPRIKKRIADGRPIDEPGAWIGVQRPARPKDVAAAEAKLGFALPHSLRQLYTEIGNGGFGPFLGLIPLSRDSLGKKATPDETRFTLVESYLDLVKTHPKYAKEPWPTGVVPVFYGGCSSFEFANCNAPNGPIVAVDPGNDKWWELVFAGRRAIPSLEERLELWLDEKSPGW